MSKGIRFLCFPADSLQDHRGFSIMKARELWKQNGIGNVKAIPHK